MKIRTIFSYPKLFYLIYMQRMPPSRVKEQGEKSLFKNIAELNKKGHSQAIH